MKFYRIEDYKGIILNPKSFPVKGATIIAIEGYSKMFSDGYMFDMVVRGKDVGKLERNTSRTVNHNLTIKNLVVEAEQCQLLLSEPKYILEETDIDSSGRVSYGMTCSDTEVRFIQAKYYWYFRNRYPQCQFFTGDNNALTPIAVKKEGVLVGIVMPILSRRKVAEVESGIDCSHSLVKEG